MNRIARIIASVLIIVLVAGCLSGGVGSQTVTPTDTLRANATPSNSGDGGSPLPCLNSLNFWGVDIDGGNYVLTPDTNGVQLGFVAESGAKVLLVATENDTILGTQFDSSEQPIAADGYELHFDEPLNGTHTVVVSAYADSNRNREFDRGIDRPCTDGEGKPLRTQALTLNFSSEYGD